MKITFKRLKRDIERRKNKLTELYIYKYHQSNTVILYENVYLTDLKIVYQVYHQDTVQYQSAPLYREGIHSLNYIVWNT